MNTKVLKLTVEQHRCLQAGFETAFGCEPTHYFSAPAVPRLAATTPTTSGVVCWLQL